MKKVLLKSLAWCLLNILLHFDFLAFKFKLQFCDSLSQTHFIQKNLESALFHPPKMVDLLEYWSPTTLLTKSGILSQWTKMTKSVQKWCCWGVWLQTNKDILNSFIMFLLFFKPKVPAVRLLYPPLTARPFVSNLNLIT